MYIQKQGTQVFISETLRRKPLPRGKFIMLISAVIVLVMTIGLTLLSIENMYSLKYEQAAALMDSNNLLKAKEEFSDLKGYRDSAGRAQECQDRYDFDCADALLQSGDFINAKTAFIALGDFGNAPEKVMECDYAAAMALMDSGELKEARYAFLALGSFSDSEEQADRCRTELDYIAATELLYQQDYAHALDAFESLGAYKDSESMAKECSNYLDYAKAEKAFSEENFYTAYLGFLNLGIFSDSAERAAACIQKNPKSGQIYRNPTYNSKACPLTIKTPKDGYTTFIKIYGGDTLVSSLFIAPGKKVTVKLPPGTYIIKEAFGITWFGQNEMFGDEDAYYGIVGDNFKLEEGYVYSLTYGSKKGNTESTEIGRADF
jgi:hypothetical protein